MIFIAHRGNITGPKPLIENDPVYVRRSLDMGFNAEIDVWSINGNYILGHDSPQYFVKQKFLENEKLWCHAKNLEALERMSKNKKIHCFWHQNDDFTLTSKGYIWTYPNKKLTASSICVLPELRYNKKVENCFGVCSDYIENYQKKNG